MSKRYRLDCMFVTLVDKTCVFEPNVLRELDPVPNPPYFSSCVIRATLDYLSKCHSANHKSLVAILSKTPVRCCFLSLPSGM